MPRLPRIFGDGVHYHIILRCNNREHLLEEKEDFNRLLILLQEAREKFSFKLYNYEFLHSHIHLMLSTRGEHYTDKIMHELCLKFAKDFNKRHQRVGHLWAHRYRCRVIKNEQQGLACLRYQNRNALSAGIVTKPEEWPWSGYHFYALGIPNILLEPHPSYLGLHEDEIGRRFAYKLLVNMPIPSDKIKNLLEKAGGKETRRFTAMVKQTEHLRSHRLPSTRY